MKKSISAALLLGAATVRSQMTEGNTVFREFGSCSGKEYGSYTDCANPQPGRAGRPNAMCCNFVIQGESTTGQFCVTD